MKRPLASISVGRWIAGLLLGSGILLSLAGCGGGTASTGGGNPVPTITVISPTSAVAGSAAGFTLTVNGTNFVSASAVNFARASRALASIFALSSLDSALI